MRLLITGASTELGRELLRQLSFEEHQVTGLIKRPSQAKLVHQLGAESRVVDAADQYDLAKVMYESEPDVIINVLPQRSNTLLHDGLAWRNIENSLPAQTAALLHAANDYRAPFLLHASFAFLYGSAVGHQVHQVDETFALSLPPDNTLLRTAAKCEQMVMENEQFPVCTLRMGYLYGPQSHDLALYENSFRLRRPYYAGTDRHLANFVHFQDAARALVLAVEKRPVNAIINIVDGEPASFQDFIDYYALCLRGSKPRHLPRIFAKLAPLITKQQIQQLDIRAAPVDNHKASEILGWSPEFPSYKQGLEQTVRVQRGSED